MSSAALLTSTPPSISPRLVRIKFVAYPCQLVGMEYRLKSDESFE
jgi:hypothetical protein